MAKTYWHPVFVELVKLSLGDYYEVEPEVSVSDLPRRADLMVIRRQEGPEPPFRGLWNHLTDWNVIEFKGPTDAPEEIDLDLLLHVGCGLTVRIDEERRSRKEEWLENRHISFWYIAASLGETFLARARDRARFDYEAGGLYRGRAWGHPIFLVSSRDVPVEVDTIPLHLIRRDEPAPRAVGELVVGREELLGRFVNWFEALQPKMWEEVKHMTGSKGIIDWETLGKYQNLTQVIPFIPPDQVIEMLGDDRAAQILVDRALARGGADKLIEAILSRLPAEQRQEILRGQQQDSAPAPPADPLPTE